MAEVSMSVADVGQFRRDPSGWCSHLPCVRASSHCPGHEGVHDSSRPAGHQQRLVRLPNSRTATDLMQRAPHSRLAVPCTGEGLERLYEGRVAGDLPSLETTGTLRARHFCSALRRPARCDPGRWRCDTPRYQQQCSGFPGGSRCGVSPSMAWRGTCQLRSFELVTRTWLSRRLCSRVSSRQALYEPMSLWAYARSWIRWPRRCARPAQRCMSPPEADARTRRADRSSPDGL